MPIQKISLKDSLEAFMPVQALANLTKVQLQALATGLGLPKSGNKTKLIERLTDNAKNGLIKTTGLDRVLTIDEVEFDPDFKELLIQADQELNKVLKHPSFYKNAIALFEKFSKNTLRINRQKELMDAMNLVFPPPVTILIQTTLTSQNSKLITIYKNLGMSKKGLDFLTEIYLLYSESFLDMFSFARFLDDWKNIHTLPVIRPDGIGLSAQIDKVNSERVTITGKLNSFLIFIDHLLTNITNAKRIDNIKFLVSEKAFAEIPDFFNNKIADNEIAKWAKRVQKKASELAEICAKEGEQGN